MGFDACYSADEIYHKDMWTLFGAAAARTRRIRLGPEVTHVILRDPTMIAQQAATLDELTGGRAEIVYSLGNLAMLEQYHVEWRGTKPLARLREAFHVMRTFLDEGAIDFEGDFYRYTGLFTAARPVQARLPLKIGAMRGPGSFRLAGEIADGVHVACAHSEEALRFAADSVREGAVRGNRALADDFDFCASILGAIALDGSAAREAARVASAFYISSMPPELVERHGIPYDEVRPVVEAFGRGDVDTALGLGARLRRRAPGAGGDARGVGRAHTAGLRSPRVQPHRPGFGRSLPRRALVGTSRGGAAAAARAAHADPGASPAGAQPSAHAAATLIAAAAASGASPCRKNANTSVPSFASVSSSAAIVSSSAPV